MKKIILFSILVCLSIGVFAQTEVTTNDGKKVILNNDGTWNYIQTDKTDTIDKLNDCNNYIDINVDKVTGKSSISAKDVLIVSKNDGKNGFGIFVMKSGKKTIILNIQAVGAGSCIDDNNKMNILFRDGTRLELFNDGKFNCDAKYTQYFGDVFGKNKELEMFRTKEVEIMRIWT